MKICEYIPSASFIVGGGEIYPLMQARSLLKLGHKVDVVTLRVNRSSEYFSNFVRENPNLSFEYLNSPLEQEVKFENKPLDHITAHKLYFSLSRELEQLCFKKKYDLVITHYGPAALSVPKSIKQLLILHGVPSEWQEANDTAIRIADLVASDSSSISKGWKKMFNYDKKILVIGNAIDPTLYFPLNIEKNIDILYVGRLIEIKGVQDLVRSVGEIRKRGVIINTFIAGVGPYLPELKKLVKDLNLRPEVKFLGYVNEDYKNNLYNRAKVTVFPSYAKEGVLTTMLEAASAQSAIITTDCCGMIDFLKNNKNGLLFEPRNVAELSNCIVRFLNDDNLREKLSRNARKDVLKKWTWESNAKTIEKLMNL